MANPKGAPHLIKHRQFKKGQSGNPDGARKHDQVKKAVRRLTLDTVKQMIEDVTTKDPEELKRIYRNKKMPVLEAWFAKIAERGLHDCDMQRMRFLLEYTAGKVPDKIEATGKDGGPQVIITMPGNGREAKKSDS